jgi:hypothetical protein
LEVILAIHHVFGRKIQRWNLDALQIPIWSVLE